MAYLIGVILALGVGVFATAVRFDRDRAFYPVVAIVVASYYLLFAAMGGSTRTLILESLATAAFVGCAVVGFRFDLRFAAFALAAHGVFDALHPHLIANAGVPQWWPAFCGSYDVVAAAYLAALWRVGRLHHTFAPGAEGSSRLSGPPRCARAPIAVTSSAGSIGFAR